MINIEKARIIKLNVPYARRFNGLEETVKGMLFELYQKSKYKIADDRFYETISVGISNNTKELNSRAIMLTLSQDSDKFNGHMLEISMLFPTMKEIKRPLVYGNKETILEFLNNKNSIKQIKKDLLAMNEEAL